MKASLISKVFSVVGDRYQFLLTGVETQGAYAVFDFFVPPGGGTPPHVHRREDEAFCVIEGEFEFVVDDQPIRVGPGGYVFGKRDVPHCFRNVGTTPGRITATVTPAGLEDFFAEVGTELPERESPPIPLSPADIEKLLAAAPRYGLEMLH